MSLLHNLQSALSFGLMIVASSAAPPPDRTVQDWAEQERVISRVESRYPGEWRNERFPVAVEIMDALSPHDPSTLIPVRGSAQTIKSELGKNLVGATITDRPRGILIVLPSTDEVTKFETTKLDPMIRACDALQRRVYGGGTRSPSQKSQTKRLKTFRDGFIQITHATSSKGLQMITVGVIVAEEVAEYPVDTDKRGHALDQAIERGTQYEGELKVYVPSTPGNAGSCKITELFEAGDQRWIFWKCPECGDHFRFRFAHMLAEDVDGGSRAVCAAPCCGSILAHEAKREMNKTARFVPTFSSLNPDNTVPWAIGPDGKPNMDVIPADQFEAALNRDCEGRDKSFHIWRGQSPFSSWASIWKKWQTAKDDPTELRVFYQQYLGEPYQAAVDVPKTDQLLAARGGAPDPKTQPVRRGYIPSWAGLVTIAADVQGNRIEWQAQAHGPRDLSAVIDTGVIDLPPQDPRAWVALDRVFSRDWPSSHLRPQKARRCGVDTGGHATQESYRFIAGHPHYHGIKGRTGIKARFGPLTEFRMTGRMRGANARTTQKVPLLLLNTHELKKGVFFGLQNLLAANDAKALQSGYHLFLHDEVTEAQIDQITSEHLIIDAAKDSELWERIAGRANEQLDLCVYNRALGLVQGTRRMTDADWTSLFAREAIDPAQVDMGPLEQLMHAAANPDDGQGPDMSAEPITPAPRATPTWLNQFGKIGKY
jgi:phage terminase large subunit GpA-like protein